MRNSLCALTLMHTAQRCECSIEQEKKKTNETQRENIATDFLLPQMYALSNTDIGTLIAHCYDIIE